MGRGLGEKCLKHVGLIFVGHVLSGIVKISQHGCIRWYIPQWAISVGHTTTLHVLEIKKIYQHIVNNANLSVLKLEKRYLNQNGVEFHHKLIGNQFRGLTWQK